MVAALTSFAVAMSVLLVGEITGRGISARGDMHELASGLIRPRTIAIYAAIVVVALLATYAAIASGRRVRREVVRRSVLAVIVGAALAALIVPRWPRSGARHDVGQDSQSRARDDGGFSIASRPLSRS